MFGHHKFVFAVLLLLLCTFVDHVVSINVLAIVSMPLRSHYMAFQKLFRELANRGHNVTVMNNFPDDEPPPNLKFIDLLGDKGGFTPPLEVYEGMDSSYMQLFNIYRHFELGPIGARIECENLFTNEHAQAHLAAGMKYDVIFVEQFMSDCGLAYAGTFYDAPIIGITSHVLLPWAYPRLGIPFDVAADAFYFSNAGPNPSLFEKVETAIIKLYFNTIGRWHIQKNIYDVFDRYLHNDSLDIERLARERMKMMFSYQHYSISGARILAPQLLEIGGIHVGTPKAVSKMHAVGYKT